MKKIIQDKYFYKLLFWKTAFPILTIVGVSLIYIFLMSVIDHRSLPFPFLILVLSSAKTIIISATTLKQLTKIITNCHSTGQILWVFGLLIGMSILSFATDYTCLYQFDHTVFKGLPDYASSYIYNLYHFIYFSIITFSTVGYGDITPVSDVARFVVMLEIFLSFFIVVFALTNIKKIQL